VDERPFRVLDAPLASGARVTIEPLTLEDGTQLVLEVSPVEVFAKNVEIVVHGPDGDSHIAPPSDHWFAGRVVGDPESFVVLARGSTLRGLVVTGARVAAISPVGDAYGTRPAGPSFVRSFSPNTDVPEAMRNFTCGSDSLTGPFGVPAIAPSSARRPLTSVMYYAGVAIETDYEMFQTRGSPSALAQYVGDLFAASTAIYQRDLLVTIQVNYLSIWTTPSDPWVATTSINGLYEFGDYWHAHRSAVPRKTAHFLSGRNLGGGVAWVGVLCSSDFLCSSGSCGSGADGHYGGGYGISGNMSGQFSTTNPGLYWDLFVVTHEIGHNFGTRHTHCYSPPVDMCWSGENGCYSGPTSVPSVLGTIMSYCHTQPGGFSNDKLFFGVAGEPSQAVTTLMRNYIEGSASCFGTVAGPVVSAISPTSGSTTGGTPVTITGSGFTAPATVKIGGTSAASVVVVNATTITAGTPAGAAGAADVSVIVTGNQGATLVGGFTYSSSGSQAPPSVSSATTLHPLTPCRLLDTRNAAAPLGGPSLGGSSQRSFVLTSTCGVPSGAVAVSANVTVVNPAAQGDLLVYPSGISAPTASTISFRAGKTRANNSQIYLALDGSIVVHNNSGGALDFVVDVNGYYQ
jgi:Metallo-peptidase family M12/IPT/TIG domain